MPAEIYEVVALAARFWFLLLMGLIVWYSYRWYARERRARKRLLDELPDAGFVGEFVVMRSTGKFKQGDALHVPFEGTLGMLFDNDIVLDAPGVAPRHIHFRYDRKRGLKMLPIKQNNFCTDRGSSEDSPAGLFAVHGTRLYVGDCELRLRMFEGYEVNPPPGETAPVYVPIPPVGQEAGLPPAARAPIPYGPAAPVQADGYRPAGYAAPAGSFYGRGIPAEPPASPYGRRIRGRFSAGRVDASPTAGESVQTANPYRSRRTVYGFKRVSPDRAVSGTPEPQVQEAAPPQPEETVVKPTAPTAPGERSACAPVRDDTLQTAEPIRQEKMPPAAETVHTPAPEPEPAASASSTEPVQPKASRAEAIQRAAASADAAPAKGRTPEPRSAAHRLPAAEDELFQPLMDEDDWDSWEEIPAPHTPAALQQPQNNNDPDEEDWPYLSRPDQWRTEGLFADLLDDDGTDAAQPGGAYGSRDMGTTARRMLSRYFKGGGR